MKSIVILLLLIIVNSGCFCPRIISDNPEEFHLLHTISEMSDNESDCFNIYNKITNEWKVNNTFDCYYYNEKLVKLIVDNKNCFIGKHDSVII